MAKDPAFLFYSSDFLTGTRTMNFGQIGKYITLLCLQHQVGELSEKDMLNICGTYDEDIWCKFEKTAAGKFFNARMKEEVDKRKAYSESRANNRKSGNKKKKSTKNISLSYVQHMENENENENIIEIENETENKKRKKSAKTGDGVIYPFRSPQFIATWQRWVEYRKDMKKPYRSNLSVQAALKKLSEYPEETAIRMIEQSIANSWQGIFEIKTTTSTSYGKKTGAFTDQELAAAFERKRQRDASGL